MTRFATLILALICSLAGAQSAQAAANGLTDPRLQAPPGFVVETLPFDVPNARQMALTPSGTLIVGTRRAGDVYAVPDALIAANPDVHVIASDLLMPSGVAMRGEDLYIAATNRVLRVRNIDRNLQRPALETIIDTLPDKRHHGWKYAKFGADGYLYFPVGAPCNICLSEDPRFASMMRLHPQTGATDIWAHGIRNSVGFAWHPVSGELWFTDNGRDMLGDDVPAEELNVAPRAGLHFGYPFVHATDVQDPKFGKHPRAAATKTQPPVVEIQAHSAALGVDFYTGSRFPANYTNALFIAEHGSWNRSSKVGYQVSVVTGLGTAKPVYAPFITGWLQGEKDWGRPNDVLVTPTGNLLISDDKAGRIYRVSYQPPVAHR